jgi:hypothetical protein
MHHVIEKVAVNWSKDEEEEEEEEKQRFTFNRINKGQRFNEDSDDDE